MKRSPKSNPQAGDVIQWKDWRITVLRRESDTVTYRAARKDGYTKPPASCRLAEWKERAKGARAVETALNDDQCVTTPYVSGPCDVDGQPIIGDAHCTGLNVRCEAHCQGSHRA